MQAHIGIRVGFALSILLLVLQGMASTPTMAETGDWLAVSTPTPVPDTDGDGLEDAEELWVAKTFAPVYQYDKEEHNIITGHKPVAEGPDVAYFYQVTQAFCDIRKAEVTQTSKVHTVLTVVAAYPYDYVPWDPFYSDEQDRWAHNGDTEMIRICFQTLFNQPSNWSQMHGAVYQRKNGGKKVWYLPTIVIIKRHTDDPVWYKAPDQMQWESATSTHFRLYISEGKHAAYPSYAECAHYVSLFEKLAWDENCTETTSKAIVIRPTSLQTAKCNVGEASKPALVSSKVFGNSRTEYFWGDKQRFCGGINTFSPDDMHTVVSGLYDERYCGGALGGKWIGQATKYTIKVKTTKTNDGGTSANVYVDLFGSKGDARYVMLDNDENNFEKGDLDTFTARLGNLGDITSLCVHHDDTGDGSGWNLSYIAVSWGNSSKTFDFKGQWLALDEKPNRLWACRPKDTWPSGVWLPKEQ